MRKVLFLNGGWEGHRPEECSSVIAGLLEKHDFSCDHSSELSILDSKENLKKYDLIIPNWSFGTLSEIQEQNLCDTVLNGAGIGGWHGGMGDAFRNSIRYQFMIGGQFVAHPGDMIDYQVQILEPRHEITQDPEIFNFRLNSEQYYMHVDPKVQVLAKTVFKGGDLPWIDEAKVPVSWIKSWGKGRVFYLSIGHSPEELKLPVVSCLTLNGLLWAARKNTGK